MVIGDQMKIMHKLLIVSLTVVCIVFSGCTRDMNIQNPNVPDTERLLTNEEEIEDLIGTTFLTFWQGWMYWYPSLALSVLGETTYSIWSNGGVKDLERVPRQPYSNSPEYKYKHVTEKPWELTYSAILSANDALRILDKGQVSLNEEVRARAFCKFIQGIGHGALGLFFDRGAILDEYTNLQNHGIELQDYEKMIFVAVGYLTECIELCDSSFTTPDSWINGFPITNEYLKQLCHSLIARFLAVSPRNPEERAEVDWNEVIKHIDLGITYDFTPEGDNDLWMNDSIWNIQRGGWMWMDNRMHGQSDTSGNYEKWLSEDYNSRSRFDNYSLDRRITGNLDDPFSEGKYMYYSDWEFFWSRRGTIRYCNYHWKKFRYHFPDQFGPMPYLTVVEMDMLKAEALMRTGGSRAEVAELINRTRVGIGEMPPLTGDEPDIEIWKWLCYEKRLETFGSEPGLHWYDLRGWSDFEFLDVAPGTPVHFPIPGKDLAIMQMDNYTFGGEGNPGSTPSFKQGVINKEYISAIKKKQRSNKIDKNGILKKQ